MLAVIVGILLEPKHELVASMRMEVVILRFDADMLTINFGDIGVIDHEIHHMARFCFIISWPIGDSMSINSNL